MRLCWQTPALLRHPSLREVPNRGAPCAAIHGHAPADPWISTRPFPIGKQAVLRMAIPVTGVITCCFAKHLDFLQVRPPIATGVQTIVHQTAGKRSDPCRSYPSPPPRRRAAARRWHCPATSGSSRGRASQTQRLIQRPTDGFSITA